MSSGKAFCCPHCGFVIMDKISDTGDFGKNSYSSEHESPSQEFLHSNAIIGPMQ